MTTLVENIRKVMGWCPQQDFESMQSQTECAVHALSSNVNPVRINSEPVERMDVLLQGAEIWRMIAFMLVMYSFFVVISFVDHLYRTPVSYLAVVLVGAVIVTSLFLLEHTKMTIDSEVILIQTPFFKSISIQKSHIKEIKTIDNMVYSQRKWSNIVLLMVLLLFAVMAIWELYSQLVNSMRWEDTTNIGIRMTTVFLFIFMFYRHYRKSLYPKVIRMDVGNKNITLFPRNDFEYDILKEKLGQ